jgi:hypothetical protein
MKKSTHTRKEKEKDRVSGSSSSAKQLDKEKLSPRLANDLPPFVAPLPPVVTAIASLCWLDDLDIAVESYHWSFETFLFCYSAVHLFIAHYNLYRMNFFNYEFCALVLSLCALVRRSLLKSIHGLRDDYNLRIQELDTLLRSKARDRETRKQLLIQQAQLQALKYQRLCMGGMLWFALFLVSTYCAVALVCRHSLQSSLFVFLPWLLYWVCFHFPFHTTYDLDDQRTRTHLQLRHLLYSCLWFTHHITILPLQFVSTEHLYFPVLRYYLLILYVFLNTFVILSLQFLHQEAGTVVAVANATGGWYPYYVHSNKDSKPPFWSPSTIYSRAVTVLHKGTCYKAIGVRNTSSPNQFTDFMFWYVFRDIDRAPRPLVLLQIIVTLSLLTFLLRSRQWVIYTVMLLFNYCLLWCGMRVRKNILYKTLPISQQLSSLSFSGLIAT